MEIKQEILKGDVVSRLFEPVSNLKRSIEAMERGNADVAWVEGATLVHKQFQAGFKDLGLEEIEAAGKRFDTRWHEALTTMPVDQEDLHDAVVQVFSPGFRIGQRCIQPARVVVGAWTPPPASEGEE
jgi:molecular chaperone GrpE